MKLLHDFFRLRLAGLRTASVRGAAVSPQFSVTVPAPLAKPAGAARRRARALSCCAAGVSTFKLNFSAPT